MKFKFLTGDVNWQDYGGKWISPRLDNGEFYYWLVIELVNMWDATGDENADKYCVSLAVVSPDEAGKENVSKADDGDYCAFGDDECRVDALHSYGIYAQVWYKGGNNYSKLLKEAREQAHLCNMLFGFYMDRPVNAIGNTGWDAIRGDIGLGKRREDDDENENKVEFPDPDFFMRYCSADQIRAALVSLDGLTEDLQHEIEDILGAVRNMLMTRLGEEEFKAGEKTWR